MLQTGSRNKNTTNKAGTIPLIPGDHHTDPTIFTHCIKAVGSRHYVDGWPLSDAHGPARTHSNRDTQRNRPAMR